MAMMTLLDIQKQNNADPIVGLIEEVVAHAPEVEVGAARPIPGIEYKTLVCTSLPTAQFRNINEGVTPSTALMENRLVQTFTLDLRVEVDKAAADRATDGWQAVMAQQAALQMRAGLFLVGQQFYYGTGTNGDAKGFPGLLGSYDSTNMVVDATGTTESTCSSVWAVKWGMQDVQFVWGLEGSMQPSEVKVVRVTDSTNKVFDAYSQNILAYPGLQVGNKYAIGRIKKLTGDSGKGLTDSLISQLLEKFPVGHQPDVLFMTRRSRGQLQRSRTATNPTGAPAPMPEEAFGIPIQITEAISNTELLAS